MGSSTPRASLGGARWRKLSYAAPSARGFVPSRRVNLKKPVRRDIRASMAEVLRRLLTGGSRGNEQLTSAVASVILVLLAAEGATLLNLRSLLTVHAFVGVPLIPIVVLKLASTRWHRYRRALTRIAGGRQRLDSHTFRRACCPTMST